MSSNFLVRQIIIQTIIELQAGLHSQHDSQYAKLLLLIILIEFYIGDTRYYNQDFYKLSKSIKFRVGHF